MGQIHFKRSIKIAISGLCLPLIGLTAAVMITALRNGLIVLIPFALATLVSLGAIWWAQRCPGNPTLSAPPGTGEDRAK